MTKSPFGKPAKAIAEDTTKKLDKVILTTRCALCADFEYIGPAKQGRAKAAAHRADRHPDVVQTRRRRGHLNRWNVSDDGWREEGNANAAEVAAMHAAREARQSAA